jgi:hypothetical protein
MLLIGASMLTVVALAQPGGGALVSVLGPRHPPFAQRQMGTRRPLNGSSMTESRTSC